MGKDHRGQPSGTNKDEGMGLRSDMPPEKEEQDRAMAEKYPTEGDEVPDNLRLVHPNRNTDKEDNSGPAYS